MFKLGGIIFDRIVEGLASKISDGTPLYRLTQLTDATITISATSVDAVDATETLIKRFWRGKTGEFSATNAMLDLDIVGAASGSGIITASADNKIKMPGLLTVDAKVTEIDLPGYVADSAVFVNGANRNGSLGTAYKSGVVANTTDFHVDSEQKKLSLPTGTQESQFIIKYTKEVESGGMITNKADKFPQTVNLLLKALAVDPCDTGTLRAIYIELPSFQVSPEVEINFATDGQLNYTGALQVDYCSADKALYNLYWAEEDVEDEDGDAVPKP